MQIDYKNMLDIVKLRKQQIEDDALEHDHLNDEFINLTKVEAAIRTILKAECAYQKRL